jgi:tetratricopeptide (TPR) repeat protein
MQRYEDAVDADEGMIEYLRHNSDEYDRALTSEYLNLAQTYSEANNWESDELNLQIAISLSEKRLVRYSGDTLKSQDYNSAVGDKDTALYWLINVYNHEGKTDYALGTAEDLYSWIPYSSAPWSDLWPFPRKEVAKLAVRAAAQANRKDAIDLWSQRLNPAPNPTPMAPRAYNVGRPTR